MRAEQLDVGALAALAVQLPIAPAQRQLLTELAPRGRINDADVEWQGRFPHVTAYRVRGDVEKLGMNPLAARAALPAADGQPAQAARPALPGFQNLSGRSMERPRRQRRHRFRQARAGAAGLVRHPEMPFDQPAMHARSTLLPDDQLPIDVDSLNLSRRPQGELGRSPRAP